MPRFKELIEGPALDVGCGTGRLLVPLLKAGIDIEGADASADMITWYRRALEDAGLDTTLYVQRAAELETGKQYQTVMMCGTLGIATDLDSEVEGLRRIHQHLVQGGRLVFDHHLPYHPGTWMNWVRQPELPQPWPEPTKPHDLGDGTSLSTWMRGVDFDPLEQTLVREMRAELYRDGEVIKSETHRLNHMLYFKNDVLLMLRLAGFGEVEVYDGLSAAPPRAWKSSRIMFVAHA